MFAEKTGTYDFFLRVIHNSEQQEILNFFFFLKIFFTKKRKIFFWAESVFLSSKSKLFKKFAPNHIKFNNQFQTSIKK